MNTDKIIFYIIIGIFLSVVAFIACLIYKLKHKKFLFGWANIKFVVVELVKTFSNEHSFFASKRIERALFVCSGLGAINYYIIANIHKLSSGEIIALSSVLLACGGYLLKQTQNEKNLLAKLPKSVKDEVDKVQNDAVNTENTSQGSNDNNQENKTA